MKVISITPRGYCKGVTKAIKAVKDAYNNPTVPKPIHVLGYIVHNKYVIDELNQLGIITLDDTQKDRLSLIDDIETGTVILSAHGTDPLVKEKLHNKGLYCIDATCVDVEKTFSLIKEYAKKGFTVFYIGKANHPEAIAALAQVSDIHLIENRTMIPKRINKPVFVTNQTTFSMFEIGQIIDEIISQYPNTLVSEEICDATSQRQQAIINFNKDVDLCYIVGDPRSNNTKNLVLISENITKTKTFLIESVKDINLDDLEGIMTVSVSSGASTPNYLTQEVIDFLKNYQPLK